MKDEIYDDKFFDEELFLENHFYCDESRLKISDIVKKSKVYEEEMEIATDLAKRAIISKIYLEFYDMIRNPVFVDDTQATKMVKKIQKILIKYFKEDFIDEKEIICSIVDVFKENKIFV